MHPHSYEHSINFPLQCDHHHEQPIFCTPSFPWPSFPSHHDLVASTKHNTVSNDRDREFLRVIIHSSILYLDGNPDTYRSTYFVSPRASFHPEGGSFSAASHPLHPPCHYDHIRFEILYMSNHNGRHEYIDIDMMICWLHWLYDYTVVAYLYAC